VSEPAAEDAPPLDLAGFVALYPWPTDVLARAPIERLHHRDLAAPPAAVWPYVADRSRLSRTTGMARMVLAERDGRLHGSAEYGGLQHEWIEEPWQWIAGREYAFVRDYQKGPPQTMRCVFRLEPLAGGTRTRLYVYYGFIPRHLLARLGLRFFFRGFHARYDEAIDAIEAGVGLPVEQVFKPPPTAVGEAGRARLTAIRAELIGRGLNAALLDRVLGHVTEADDLAAYRIQVRRLARDWGVGERALLEVFLHATRAGLFELSWDVICPHCRGVRDEAATLADVASRGRCDVCAIDFDTAAENAVEITFHVHASIRRVEKVFYCSAEPSTKAHIRVQQHLLAGQRRRLSSGLAPGRYRVRFRGEAAIHPLEVVAGGAAETTLEVGRSPSPDRIAPDAALALFNPGDAPVTLAIEEPAWADDALRPAQLFNVQTFRDLFGEEYLGASVQLNVGEQTILFTDIVGSTRYYREVGDPSAFVAVKRHFAAVFGLVRAAGGAVVKTIGDAVMASFDDPIAALQVALDIHALMTGEPDAPAPVRLRISLNRGPCIAVNLNSGIDYFGGTVNTAAKLQRCAEAGEVALGESVWRAPGVEAFLAARPVELRATTLEHDALGTLNVVVAGPRKEPRDQRARPAQAAAKPAI
jgi:class 3 adenylate cyclase